MRGTAGKLRSSHLRESRAVADLTLQLTAQQNTLLAQRDRETRYGTVQLAHRQQAAVLQQLQKENSHVRPLCLARVCVCVCVCVCVRVRVCGVDSAVDLCFDMMNCVYVSQYRKWMKLAKKQEKSSRYDLQYGTMVLNGELPGNRNSKQLCGSG